MSLNKKHTRSIFCLGWLSPPLKHNATAVSPHHVMPQNRLTGVNMQSSWNCRNSASLVLLSEMQLDQDVYLLFFTKQCVCWPRKKTFLRNSIPVSSFTGKARAARTLPWDRKSPGLQPVRKLPWAAAAPW